MDTGIFTDKFIKNSKSSLSLMTLSGSTEGPKRHKISKKKRI